MDYDPTQLTYEQLLDVFWASHDPTIRSLPRQYMSVIFYHHEEQERLARLTKERETARRGVPICTGIVPYSAFYRAEAYHQKYRLRQDCVLMRDFNDMYPTDEDFTDSTAATRVNGYLYGHGTMADLQNELDGLGLSPEGRALLLDRVRPRRSSSRLF